MAVKVHQSQVGVGPGPSYNCTPQNFAKLRRALARVRSATASGSIFCVGDSTTEGFGGTTPYSQAYPSILAGLLNSYYVPAAQTWAIPHNTPGTPGPGVDSRVSMGGSWTDAGGYWSLSTGQSGTLAYQPSPCSGPATVDTLDIYFVSGQAGSLAVNINGGSTVATVTFPGTGPAVGKATVTFTATANPTINLVASSSPGNAFILGLNAYLSTSPVIQVANFGYGGATSAWAMNTGNWNGWLYASLTPDLTIFDFGINDAGASTSAATFQSNMQTLITAAQAKGDVLLKSMVPTQGAPYTTFEPLYLPVLAALAASNSCGFLDVYSRWVSYIVSNAMGYYADGTHPGPFGYSDVAQAVFDVLKTI